MIAAVPEGATAEELVEWTYQTHSRVVLVSSFQAESGVLIDMASRIVSEPEVLTLDTGWLPEETHTIMQRFRDAYGIRLHVRTPDAGDVEAMTREHGTMAFRSSVELRHLCCEVRKVRPLTRALQGYDAWITGLRRDQSASRATTPAVVADVEHGGITKVAPLAAWSRDRVWRYMEEHAVPRHPLYAQGYTSIGCAPCTRATREGEDERAGRWWWEQQDDKECGVHTGAQELAG